jgi:two-component sensor histidine kinase
VASLIKLQEEDVRDEHDREVFRKNEDRIRAMATVHQMLYETDDLSRIDIANYMREVAAYTSYDAVARGVPVDVVVNADPVEIEIDRAVPLGLAVQELIRNAVKHSCSGGQRGRVELTLRRRCGGIEVTISDSGEGDATEFFQEHRRGLGTQLVNLLCDQIGGTVTPLRGPGGRIRVYVPGKP